MATIKPFKGIRPPKELVESIESRPYDVLSSKEAREEAGDNEMSLYHIIKPEIDSRKILTNMIREYIRRRQITSRSLWTRDGWFRMIKKTIISTPRP